MATSVNMSVMGLYIYDPTLFDDMYLPAHIQRDDLVYNLLLNCAEMTVLYPDAAFLKKAILYWSRSRAHAWERLSIVLYEDYDPFINIKRDELRTITTDRSSSGTGKTQSYRNAWNEGSQSPSDSADSSGNTTDKVTTTEHFHVEGDSAITDAQDVAEKEFKLRDKYDLYKYIIDDFKKQFCLQIY